MLLGEVLLRRKSTSRKPHKYIMMDMKLVFLMNYVTSESPRTYNDIEECDQLVGFIQGKDENGSWLIV